MREDITSESLPVITIVITIGNADRLVNDPEYREHCAVRLVEIVLDIDGYRGVNRLFIP